MGINLYLSPFENYTFYIAIFFHSDKNGIIGCFFCPTENLMFFNTRVEFVIYCVLRGLSETWKEETKYSQKSILRFFFPMNNLW